MSYHAPPPPRLSDGPNSSSVAVATSTTSSVAGISVSGLIAGTGALAAVTYASVAVGLPTLCPFRIGTGHACPACGLSRSLFSLIRGDLGQSVRFHPLLIPLGIQVVVIGFLQYKGIRFRWRDRLMMANLVVLFGVWAWRWNFGLLDFVIAEGRL